MRARLFALLCLLTPAPVLAATCGAGLNPVVVTATSTAFSFYAPGAAVPTHANGTVTVACFIALASTLPAFTIALSAGTTGGFTPRQLSFGTNRLGYNLYTTASYATIWGDGSNTTVTQSYSASLGLALTSFTAFGSVPAHQYVLPGFYMDSITVTATY